MIDIERLPCGAPRSIEQQIADLQYQINQLAQQAFSLNGAAGIWSASKTYAPGDIVYLENAGTYAAVQGNEGKKPTDPGNIPTYWQPLAGAPVGIGMIEAGEATQEDDKTITPVTVTLTDGSEEPFDVSAENGNGIADVITIGHSVVGTETVTNLQVTYTKPGTPPSEIEVHAENGKDGIGKIYRHEISIKYGPNLNMGAFCVIVSSNNTPFTTDSLVQYLQNAMYTNPNRYLPINYVNFQKSEFVFGIYYQSNTRVLTSRNLDNNTPETYTDWELASAAGDVVFAI